MSDTTRPLRRARGQADENTPEYWESLIPADCPLCGAPVLELDERRRVAHPRHAPPITLEPERIIALVPPGPAGHDHWIWRASFAAHAQVCPGRQALGRTRAPSVTVPKETT